MPLNKPYFRIIRPPYTNYLYMIDSNYANDRNSLIRAYKVLEKDLIKLFDYIEPNDKNLNTFSYRTYELFLRASTEFETNCKSILRANSYSMSRNLTIKDYFKLDSSSKLSDYKVYLNIWYPKIKVFEPFKDWKTGSHSLGWYKDYNNVKHDRSKNFESASLENVLNSITGLFVILFSQFYIQTFDSLQLVLETTEDNNQIWRENSLFGIEMPTWKDVDCYDFDWDKLNKINNPFEKYIF